MEGIEIKGRKEKEGRGWEKRGGKERGNRSTRCARGEEIKKWSNNLTTGRIAGADFSRGKVNVTPASRLQCSGQQHSS